MPKTSPIILLDKALSELFKRRQEHQAALADIDAVFAKYNINPAKASAIAPAKPSLVRSGAKPRRTRKQYPETAEQFVLSLLKGGKGVTSGQINTVWKDSGRKNTADNTLTLLAKKKAVKRTPLKEGRGSTYTLA